jgi:hypothetical protein
VSDVAERVQRLIRQFGLDSKTTVLADDEALPSEYHPLPGWLRQQVVKLMADTIAKSDYIACMGADTIILKSVEWQDLVSDNGPILYFNRYPQASSHLEYERKRVRSVARLLAVDPVRSLPFGDFVMDLCLFERRHLLQLRAHVDRIHGESGLLSILPERCETLDDKLQFGEWSLYAVYLLDIIHAENEVRNSASAYLAQVHSQRDLEKFTFDSQIVHFVSKEFDTTEIIHCLKARGLWIF